jgi:hypothetical protein
MIDHVHGTNVVRGVLCHACNVSEGMLKAPARARGLAEYMEKHGIFSDVRMEQLFDVNA